jgi:hypothetical protein
VQPLILNALVPAPAPAEHTFDHSVFPELLSSVNVTRERGPIAALSNFNLTTMHRKTCKANYAQIAAVVHQKGHDELLASIKNGEHRTTFRSCGSKESAAWILSTPCARKANQLYGYPDMPDRNFRISAQRRLHCRITPVPHGMVPEAFRCKECKKQLDEYGKHAWSCKFMSGFRTFVHQCASKTLSAQAKQPKHVRVVDEANVTGCGYRPKEGEFAASSGNANRFRADFIINKDANGMINPAQTLVVDVTITDPLTKITNREGGPLVETNGSIEMGDGRAQGASADRAVRRKDEKYLGRFEMSKKQFFPFAMENTGFMHSRARDLVGEIARLQSEYLRERAPVGLALQRSSIGARYRHIIERVAVAQQFGYSRMLLNYQQKCIPR